MAVTLLQHLVFGIVTGCILLLGSIGFSMIYTVKRFLNIGHAELLTTAAYIAYAFNVGLGWGLLPSSIVAIGLTTLLGLAIAQFLYKPMEAYGVLILVFTSVGVAFAQHGLLEFFAGPLIRSFKVAPQKAYRIGNIPLITPNEILIIAIALFSLVILHLLLTKTKIGKAFRAVASQMDLAKTKGIDTDRISVFVWVYASAMASLAGILLALITSVNPELGWAQLLIIMSASVLGGLGSIYGVMIGSILIGLAMDLGVILIPAGYRPAIAFALIIVMLIVKPKGIFGGE
ncbi:MAG: branched-chain amino acid ABC transporter permease [Thermodesulfobacteriota bacterium]